MYPLSSTAIPGCEESELITDILTGVVQPEAGVVDGSVMFCASSGNDGSSVGGVGVSSIGVGVEVAGGGISPCADAVGENNANCIRIKDKRIARLISLRDERLDI